MFFRKFRRALRAFRAEMAGTELVARSSQAGEIVPGLTHPDGPGGVTREEVYYNASSYGTGAPVP